MKLNRHVLKNGARVVASPSADTKSVVVMFAVKTGSRNETSEINGLSHFLEHMVFKGTKKRPTALQLAKEIESLGAISNAFTEKEHTFFFLKTTRAHFEKAVEIIYDMMFGSLLSEGELKTESKVILEEKKMSEENPMIHVGSMFEEVFFDDEKLAQSILGTVESVKSLKRKDFLSYLSKYYTASNMVVSLSGDLPKNYLQICKKYLERIKSGRETGWESLTNKKTGSIKIKYKDNFQTNLILGFAALNVSDKRTNVLRVLNGIIGGGMSSRLFQELREKRGLAYAVYSDTVSYSDAGYIGIEAGVDSKRVEEAILVIINILKDLKNTLTEEELQIAKERMKGAVAFSLEDSLKKAEFYALRELYHKKMVAEEEMLREIDGITKEMVKKLAGEIFSTKPTLALVGPFKNKGKFAKILHRS